MPKFVDAVIRKLKKLARSKYVVKLDIFDHILSNAFEDIAEWIEDQEFIKLYTILKQDALGVITEISNEILDGKIHADDVGVKAPAEFLRRMKDRLGEDRYSDLPEISDSVLSVIREIVYNKWKIMYPDSVAALQKIKRKSYKLSDKIEMEITYGG